MVLASSAGMEFVAALIVVAPPLALGLVTGAVLERRPFAAWWVLAFPPALLLVGPRS